MRQIAASLGAFLEAELVGRLDAKQAGRIQLVFVGPPDSVLEVLFDQLAASGTRDWAVPQMEEPAVVLLISERAAPPSGVTCRSARTRWDYAVTMRHGARASVVLVPPRAWDSQPESIENASDRLGMPAPRTATAFSRAEPWPFLYELMEDRSGIPAAQVARAFRDLWRDIRPLDERERDEIPWLAADEVLGGTDISRAVGLPCLAPGIAARENVRKAREVTVKLARACGADGFAEVEARLKDARQEIRDREERDLGGTTFLDDETLIPAMVRDLRQASRSADAFARSPALGFRGVHAASAWWPVMTNEVLEHLVAVMDVPPPHGRLMLQIPTLIQPIRGEPCVVVNDAHLEVVERTWDGVQPVESASFFRKCREGNQDWLDVDGGHLVDDEIPGHNRPMTYKAVLPGYADASLRVIALDHFACHGHVHVNGALRNPAPARRSRGLSPFEQLVTVRQAGVHRLVVLASSDVERVVLRDPDAEPLAAHALANQAEFTVAIEQSTQKTVTLLNGLGEAVNSWELIFQVEETTRGVAHSIFEDLILSHQEGQKTRLVLAPSCQARELETHIVASSDAYRGVLACWSPEGTTAGDVDWVRGRAGDIPIPDDLDVRPPAAREGGSERYVAARAAIAAFLRSHPEQYVAEVLLAGDEPVALAEAYLAAWLEWLRESPEAAAWADTIAVYTRTSPEHAGVQTISDEPLGLLLSPLHPLRFCWHVNAQTVLSSGLEQRCPLAGLISSASTPSVTGLPIWMGQEVDWRPFIAVACDDSHWAVLLNGAYLQEAARTDLYAVLRRLGLTPHGVTGGMSVSQAQRALNDVSALLCARPQLRVGVVGNPEEEEAGSVKGLLEWVEDGFRVPEPIAGDDVEVEEAEEASRRDGFRLSSIDVHDFRDESTHPSEVMLANLSEDVGGRLRWFDGRKSGPPTMDIVMFDQVGTTTARLRKPEWTAEGASVVGRGALFRIHVREDQSAGRVIAEARIAKHNTRGNDLATLLERAAAEYEGLARRANATHLEFTPDRQTFAGWVQTSRFLAATSSQIDPACFIRGSGEQGDYLWDYDLPSSAGADSGSAGYYLVARPRDSMKDAVRRSLLSVVDPAPPVEGFLAEISKRGIPVLKRLASGGRRSKGEVGMLLAVRLLQDAFRDVNTGVRLPVVEGSCIHMLLAVDSYQSPLATVRRYLKRQDPATRPDVLVVAIRLSEDSVRIKLTPVEIKFHTTPQNRELTDAVGQADSLAELLRTLWVEAPVNDAWDACGRALLARCVDECFRIYADGRLHMTDSRSWSQLHQRTLEAVLGTPDLARVVSVNSGRLLAFGPAFDRTRLVSMDGDALRETLLVDVADCRVLLTGEGELSSAAEEGVSSLLLSHADCHSASLSTREQVREALSTPPGPTPAEQAVAVPTTPPTLAVDVEGEASPGAEAELGEATPGDLEAEESPTSERGVGSIPAEIRVRVRSAWAGFVGNERPVRRITRDLLVALTADPPSLPRNYLLEGLPSVGKTEMARRIASALDLPFVRLDGPGLTTREKLFQLIDGQLGPDKEARQAGEDAGQPVFVYPAFVVFIDEVHLVPTKVQESLLTMLEAADRSVRLTDRVAHVPSATFIFATTQSSRLDKAFRSRCTEVQLSSYSLAEVAQMVVDYLTREGIGLTSWDPQLFPRIARLGRLVPRRAFEVARELVNELRTTEQPNLSIMEHLEVVRETMGVDENGLGRLDVQYLEVLERAGRPLGEDAIATMLGTVDKDKVLEEIEPALRNLRFIVPGVRGREITAAGREYIATRRAGG